MPGPRRFSVLFAVVAIALATLASPVDAHPEHEAEGDKTAQLTPSPMRMVVMEIGALLGVAVQPAATRAACIGGDAGGYPCNNVDLLAYVPLADMGATAGNDLWGWAHAESGREFTLFGHADGTAFVEVSDPSAPVFLGTLPTETVGSIWRDLKVFNDHVFVVSEAADHGMQVFDLTTLLTVTSPQTFEPMAHYDGFGSAHNIAINEDSGFAYAVGTATCNGGLHVVDISIPSAPVFEGCFSEDGYTHDVQCVVYHGPDTAYAGRELCIAANEDTFTIVDVTDKDSMQIIARQVYVGTGYSHQGWLTEDHRYFLLDDELDEWAFGTNTKTFIWDVADLDRPVIVDTHVGSTPAIDHNQYVAGSFTFQANYRAGLQILDLENIAAGDLEEVGSFDIFPASNGAGFNGAWSVYPWFSDGVIAISGIEQGLYLVHFDAMNLIAPAHIHDLVPRPRPIDDDRWRVVAVIKVRDSNGDPVEGAAVTGRFGSSKVRTCTTDANGKCKVRAQVLTARPKIAFTVTDVVTPQGYDPAANRPNQESGSDGTRVVIWQPGT